MRSCISSSGPAVPTPLSGNGRVPFTFRIGVTGHRELPDPQSLIPAIREAIQGLVERLFGAGAQPALFVVSGLAEGADRLVAREAMTMHEARLEAALPLTRAEYLNDFTDPGSKAEFDALLGQASMIWQPPAGGSREDGYEKAGHYIVDRCDAVIALWDGERPRGQGGTATVVTYAQQQRVPLAWVHTEGRPPSVSYLLDKQQMRAINEATREFRKYNAATIAQFPAHVRAEKERLKTSDPLAEPWSFRQVREDVADWIIPYFVRADLLATRQQQHFKVMSAAIFLMAAGAVTVVATQVSFASRQNWIVVFEVILLLALVVLPLISRRRKVLDRWTESRFLAERLRSAYYLALAGTGDRAERGRRRHAYLSDPSEAWIQRALTGVMDHRPAFDISKADLPALREYLAGHWIGGQIYYHRKAAEQQGAWERWLYMVTGFLFTITLIVAMLHLHGLGEQGERTLWWGHLLIVLSISLPAIGAAVHGIRSQAQFRRQCQRYHRMADLLERLQADMKAARSLARIRAIAAETEQVMREENSDWFGVVRFHDVELIT